MKKLYTISIATSHKMAMVKIDRIISETEKTITTENGKKRKALLDKVTEGVIIGSRVIRTTDESRIEEHKANLCNIACGIIKNQLKEVQDLYNWVSAPIEFKEKDRTELD